MDNGNSVGDTVAMSRPERNQQASEELAAHLAVEWSKLPYPKPSWPSMAKQIEARFDIAVTGETLRKMHAGQVDPRTTNPEFLIAIGLYYGVDSAKLGPSAETRLGNLLALTQNWKKMRGRPVAIEATDARAPSAA